MVSMISMTDTDRSLFCEEHWCLRLHNNLIVRGRTDGFEVCCEENTHDML